MFLKSCFHIDDFVSRLLQGARQLFQYQVDRLGVARLRLDDVALPETITDVPEVTTNRHISEEWKQPPKRESRHRQ